MVNEEKDFFETENGFKSWHACCTGAGHIKNDRVCQDASCSMNTKQYSLAVVCDGHGGGAYFRSDRGSQMAAEAFCSCVTEEAFGERFAQIESVSELPEIVRQLIKCVILRWNTAVEEDLKADPITEDEMQEISEKVRSRYAAGEKLPAIYGTTLIGFVIGKRWCFGIQIGDGKCVAANKWGQMYQPIPWDDNCFLNVTTSLSDENAYEEFRYWYSHNLDKDFPVAVFLGSDGIDDSFAGDEKLHDFYRLILKNLSRAKSMEPLAELGEYFPTLSAQGSNDDMSFGILFNPCALRWDAERWEGTGRRLYVYNSGDMDQDSYERSYTHHTMLPLAVGSYEVWMGRYGQRIVEILQVEENRAIVRYQGEEYCVTSSHQESIYVSERQATYDGPWHEAYDLTKFTLL